MIVGFKHTRISVLILQPKKIVVLIAGLLLLAAGLAMYYINLNSIASINSIASYTTIGAGGSLILGAAIWSVANWIQGKSVGHLEQVEDSTENNLNIPVSIQNNPRVWKQNFKRSVLEGHKSLLEEIPSADLTLTPEEETRLKTVIQELNTRYKTDKATVHGRNGVWVFSIKKIPGHIFKVKQSVRDCGADFHKRVAASQKAQQVIEEEKLHLLHVPKQTIIQLEIDNTPTEVLIEEQFDILHGTALQESLFQHCMADPELKPFVQECARQLVTLILKMGYSDVRYDNNPLLTNGKGIALIDLDADGSIITGLVTGRTHRGTDGILCCLSAELLESLEPLLRANLSEEDFNKLKFEQINGHLAEDAERNQRFNGYL